MAITNKIGAPVTGADFYGRAQEIAKALRYIEEKQSLLLSAPRRIGKSSLAKKLIAKKKEDGWNCIYIDLQGVATTEAFLRTLINAFSNAKLIERSRQKVKDFIDSIFSVTDSIDLGPLKIDLSHQGNIENLYNHLADTLEYANDTLIVIDELPLFLGKLIDQKEENRNDVEFLLNWFRSIRQREDSRLRWLFCGSVGLRNFTNHYHMSKTINDLVDFELGELPPDEAKGLITALADSYDLVIDNEIIQHTLESLQWPIPYFIQLIMDRIITQKSFDKNRLISIEDVNEAIDNLSKTDYFMTWHERLVEYRDLEDLARTILDNLSIAEEGFDKNQMLQLSMKNKGSIEEPAVRKDLVKVLEMLEHDGYLLRKNEKRKFRSPLLRKWWRYKFMD